MTDVQLFRQSVDFWLIPIPSRLPFALSVGPTFRRSSLVSGTLSPLASKTSLRYRPSNVVKKSGNHLPDPVHHRDALSPGVIHPPLASPICLQTSLTSARLLSYRLASPVPRQADHVMACARGDSPPRSWPGTRAVWRRSMLTWTLFFLPQAAAHSSSHLS